MEKLQLKSHIDFLNKFFNFGKEYEELGCVPLIIPGLVSNVNYETKQIWIQPTKTFCTKNKLSKLLDEWKKGIQKVKSLEESDIEEKNVYIYSAKNGKVGRCCIVKRKDERSLIHCIDDGKIEVISNDTKIYQINNDMICGEFGYPLCFVINYIPNVYCEKYRISEFLSIKIGEPVNAVIINGTNDCINGFITYNDNTLFRTKKDFLTKNEIGGKLRLLEQFCKGKKRFIPSNWDANKMYRITDDNIDSFVIGVPDHEHIYVRSINLTIAYLFFHECLCGYYKNEDSRKELSVEKINSSNYQDTFVLYDSATYKFYRVSIINYNDLIVNCYCIDQPTLVFHNIDNEPGFLWKLKDFFMLPKFLSLIKLGNFKQYRKLNDMELDKRRSEVLRMILKDNNQVHVINDSCKEFPIINHEGINLVTKYKNKLIELYNDNIDSLTTVINKQKQLKYPKCGEFGKSLNASFCLKENVLGKSLRDICLKMPKKNTSNTIIVEKKGSSESFGMCYPIDSMFVTVADEFVNYEDDEKENIDKFVEDFNKLKLDAKNQSNENSDSLSEILQYYNTEKLQYQLEEFSITNFVNENEIYIFGSKAQRMYINNDQFINSCDSSKLKEIKLENVLPDTNYLINWNKKLYRVSTGNNFSNPNKINLNDSSSEDETLEEFFFVEVETKRQIVYNDKMKIYNCPIQIIKLPYSKLEVVSLSQKITNHYNLLNLKEKVNAIEYLKKLIPPFKNDINVFGSFETTKMGNRKILTISTLDGKNITEDFQNYCKNLYTKSN